MIPSKQKVRLVHLTFWDHVQASGDNAEPIKCELVGWLYKESKIAYYLASWICEENINNPNSECYVILKSTVTKKRVVK
jgi:hypothetical protein